MFAPFGRNEAVGQSLVSDQVEFFKGDLSSKQAVEEACKGVEMVVHAGALSTVWGLGRVFIKLMSSVLNMFRSLPY